MNKKRKKPTKREQEKVLNHLVDLNKLIEKQKKELSQMLHNE